MRIIVDAMGGDNAPAAICEAAAKSCKTLGAELVLVGKEEIIRNELAKYGCCDNIDIVNADGVIANDEEPVKAIKTKKDASLVIAAQMLKNGEGDALVSCGNTGALLSAGLLIVGRIKGVKRPALATVLPGEKGPVMLLDSGANTHCRPENLVQFAAMANIYMRDVMGIPKPRIGLISNGEEESKGDDLTKEAHILLKTQDFNFVGNVEGRDVMTGDIDVVVADGFVGNVILKTVEGMGAFMGRAVKELFLKNIITKIGALFAMSGVKELKQRMDYREYGGAPLLGVKLPVIKGHGSSDAKAVMSAFVQAKKFAEISFSEKLEEYIKTQGKETENE